MWASFLASFCSGSFSPSRQILDCTLEPPPLSRGRTRTTAWDRRYCTGGRTSLNLRKVGCLAPVFLFACLILCFSIFLKKTTCTPDLTLSMYSSTSLDQLVERLRHDSLLDLPPTVHDLVGLPLVHFQHRHQVVGVAGLDRLGARQAWPLCKEGGERKSRTNNNCEYLSADFKKTK